MVKCGTEGFSLRRIREARPTHGYIAKGIALEMIMDIMIPIHDYQSLYSMPMTESKTGNALYLSPAC